MVAKAIRWSRLVMNLGSTFRGEQPSDHLRNVSQEVTSTKDKTTSECTATVQSPENLVGEPRSRRPPSDHGRTARTCYWVGIVRECKVQVRFWFGITGIQVFVVIHGNVFRCHRVFLFEIFCSFLQN